MINRRIGIYSCYCYKCEVSSDSARGSCVLSLSVCVHMCTMWVLVFVDATMEILKKYN